MRQSKILLTGGGSGGHIYPLCAVARALKKIAAAEEKNISLFYLGPKDRYADLLQKENIAAQYIVSAKLRRYASLSNLVDFLKFIWGFFQALAKMFWMMPDVVFSKGGPGALAVVLAARFYRIPVVIHESDAIPGLTTAFSARFAARIGLGFESAKEKFSAELQKKIFVSGNPVREELFAKNPTPQAAKKEFGMSDARPVTLFLGGSQGAQRMNEFIAAHLRELLGVTQILHQTGAKHYDALSRIAALTLASMPADMRAAYKPFAYFEDNMGTALSAADVVVSRAGAGVISEIAAFGKPSIIIPLPSAANDHQRENALAFSKACGAKIIEETNLLPHIVISQITDILANPGNRQAIGAAARKFFKENAAELIGREIIALADRGRSTAATVAKSSLN